MACLVDKVDKVNKVDDCIQRIVVNGSASQWTPETSGVPQETVLFNVFSHEINAFNQWHTERNREHHQQV